MKKVSGGFKCDKSIDTEFNIEDTVHYSQKYYVRPLNPAGLPSHIA